MDNETIDKCKASFDTTDWALFKTDGNLDQTVEATTNYINFVVASNCTTKQFYSNSNQRPWVTTETKQLLKAKHNAMKSGDKNAEKKIQCEMKKHIKQEKLKYKNKTLDKMSSDIKLAWKGIKSMANISNKNTSNLDLLQPDEQMKLADELNHFYTRFQNPDIPDVHPEPDPDPPAEPPDPEPPPEPISLEEVREQFRRCNPSKAAGPDSITTRVLKECYFELAPVFCEIFNLCLKSGTLPALWKLSAIKPVPKKPIPTCNNDFRPIALTSVLMKCFEQILKSRLLSFLNLDECQFAYKKDRSTKDACLSLDYFLRCHLEQTSSFARVLFVDFTSAFNTIVPSILIDKLKSMSVPSYLLSVIKDFLVDRQQYVNIGNFKSSELSCDIGCPQGCVLSPVLFSIYTDFIRSTCDNVKKFKYADDMAIVGLLNFKDPDVSQKYFDSVQLFTEQCASVNLILNTVKTKEMVVNFSKSCAIYDYVFINGNPIEKVESFKYLGTIFDNDLKWSSNTDYIYGKVKKRFYAFSRFKHFRPSIKQKHHFIQSLIQPVLTYNIELWYNGATDKQKDKLQEPFIRNDYFFDTKFYVQNSVLKLANNFIYDSHHILHDCYKTNRKFYIMPKTKTNRFLTSFVPFSIKLLNN